MADTQVKAEIEARLRGMVDAANSADREGYVNYHTEDCTVMYQDMETVHGKEAVKEQTMNFKNVQNISTIILEGIDYLQVLSDHKVYCTISSKFVNNAGKTTAKMRSVMLWRKEDDTWLIERKFQNLRELPPHAQAHADIKAQMVVLYDACTRKDVDTILKVYVDEPTWLPHGLEDVKGKKACRELCQLMLLSIKTMVLDDIFYFELFGEDVAHTNANVNLLDENGKVYKRARDDFLWKKVDGKWRIQRDAYNELPLK